MNIYSNKGMYIEEIINRSIDFYKNRNIAYFEKRNIPFQIVKKLSISTFIGKLKEKSTVDYVGIYKGIHIEFEAKETINDYFLLSSIKKHQSDHLFSIIKYGGLGFYFIYFSSYNEICLLSQKTILDLPNKKVDRDTLKKLGVVLEITYPGIIDFVPYLLI